MTKNSANTCTQHRKNLGSCFDLIRFHQQYIPGSLSLEIESATTEYRAETLPLTHRSTSHTRQIDLESLVHDVYRWLSGRVSAQHSVVTGSISSGRDHGIHS